MQCTDGSKYQRAFGELITDVKLPEVGSEGSSSYEGEGYVLVRHPETAARGASIVSDCQCDAN